MYRLYLYENDIIIGKFKTRTDDMDLIYKEYGEEIILDGLRKGFCIDKQIDKYKLFIEGINKQKSNCEKIRASDLYMYLCCYSALYKFNKVSEDHMFFKKKKRKNACKKSNQIL
jgi:hypothetical protein